MKSLSLIKPHMIIMVGLPGSGKSFFAEKFAETFNAPYVNRQRIGELTKENIDLLAQLQLNELLKTNQSVIFEGVAHTRAERLALVKIARQCGYEPLIIWVQVDSAAAKDRSTTSKDASIDAAEYERISKRFTPPNSTEKPLVISGKHTYASQARVVLKKLSSPRAEISANTATPTRDVQPTRRNITIR